MAKSEERTSRFRGPSDVIDMDRLERETQKILLLGLFVAVSVHAAIGAFYMFKKTEVKVAKPLTMELIVRRPRMKKAFEFKKKRVQKRIFQKKEIQQRQPTAKIETKQISTMDMMGSVASYEFESEIQTDVETNIFLPEGISIEMTATREPDRKISMKEEMISLDDLDTGQFKAMVIQDPSNKKDIKGFVYIATAWGSQLRPPDNLKRAVINLVIAVNRYTNIEAKVDTHLFLDHRKLFETPFVYIIADKAFELNQVERKNFGRYLRNGGFAVVDNGVPKAEFGQAEASLKKMLRDVLGSDAKFLPINNDHPLYHCFFDFPYGPPQGDEIGSFTAIEDGEIDGSRKMSKSVHFLEGIWLDERLVAIYSDKGYAHKWKDMTNNQPQLKMGVNMVVFALIQDGGIAQQKMDFFSTSQ
ncbi:DUF4159 domain-containing protein [Candidatus Latescibacterota bacterium]